MNEPCECWSWGRAVTGDYILMLNHHPNCKHSNPSRECHEVIIGLLDGIDAWSSDEDGVHPDCWEAYRRACYFVFRIPTPECHPEGGKK